MNSMTGTEAERTGQTSKVNISPSTFEVLRGKKEKKASERILREMVKEMDKPIVHLVSELGKQYRFIRFEACYPRSGCIEKRGAHTVERVWRDFAEFLPFSIVLYPLAFVMSKICFGSVASIIQRHDKDGNFIEVVAGNRDAVDDYGFLLLVKRVLDKSPYCQRRIILSLRPSDRSGDTRCNWLHREGASVEEQG